MAQTMKSGQMTGQQMSGEMQRCIDNCTNCHKICEETLSYSLQMGGKHAEASHIQMLIDCAQTCVTSADFMLRGSVLYGQVCGVCAQACSRGAQSCEQFGGDAQMKSCADMCRQCAESCRQMAGLGQMQM